MPKRNDFPTQRVHRHRHWRDSLTAMMEPMEKNSAADKINVGLCLRKLRAMRGLSIRSLAELSGLNFNTLSLIENSKTSPSVSTLQQLSTALDVPITAFFETESTQKQVIYQQNGSRPKATFTHGHIEDLGSGLSLGDGIPLLITLEPGSDSGTNMISHTGQEFVFCLEGCLTYQVSGQEYVLEPGDSLLFEAHLPHCWRNPNPFPSRSLLILCPADEDDTSTKLHFTPEAESLP